MSKTIPQSVSDQIRIARVLCIFFMIYAHVNPGVAAFDPSGGVRAFDAIRFFIVDGAARASVGLLSILSGVLAAQAFARRGYGAQLLKRARSLLVPMAVWSLAFMALIAAGGLVRDGYWAQSFGAGLGPVDWVNLVFGLTAPPANLPLAFLRDVFVCAALTPALLFALRRAPWPALIALGAAGLVSAPIGVVLTSSILFLYALGLLLADRGLSGLRIGPRFFSLSLIAFVAMGGWLAWAEMTRPLNPEAGWTGMIEPMFNLLRLPAAVVFWKTAEWILKSGLRKPVEALEPYVFTAFCSHLLVTTVIWAGWQPVLGGYYGAAYPAFFLAAPVLCFAASIMIVHVVSAMSPSLFAWINGGRRAPALPLRQSAKSAKASATFS